MRDIMTLGGVDLIRELSLEFGPSNCEDRVREMIRPRAEKIADKIVVAPRIVQRSARCALPSLLVR